MAISPKAGYFKARQISEMNYDQEHDIVEAQASKLQKVRRSNKIMLARCYGLHVT